ncbi:MAG TPA: TIGR03435 family protein [Bryobacteraceae bacterium]
MKMLYGSLALTLAFTLLAAETRPEFEVASIRPAAPLVPGDVGIGLHVDGAQVRIKSFSLLDYLCSAYRLKNYQVVGPDWIKAERYDISAKLPEGAAREQVPDMLKTLLQSRFQLKTHQESRPLPVYALVVAKSGLKLKELPPDPDDPEADKAGVNVNVGASRQGVSINLGRGSYFTFADNKVQIQKLTMTALADMLARFEDRPVLDMTGLKGKYDCTLDITPEDYRAMMIRSAIAAGVQLPPEALRLLDNASDSSLHSALEAVGLKLEPRKAPVETLVVDQASKTPTEN